MIIAINGKLGSGKSTVAKILAKELGYNYVSTGGWFRELAQKKNISVTELNLLAEKDGQIDEYIDSKLKEYNNLQDDYVIDSRMAPFFIKNALKVHITVDKAEGAKRIFGDISRGNDEKYSSFEEAIEQYVIRTKSEIERYLGIYGFNMEQLNEYDLVLDSTNYSPEEIANMIIKYLNENYHS